MARMRLGILTLLALRLEPAFPLCNSGQTFGADWSCDGGGEPSYFPDGGPGEGG